MKLSILADAKEAYLQIDKLRESASKHIDLTDANPDLYAYRIPNGTLEGRSTVILQAVDERTGTLVSIQTSLRLLKVAVDAFEAADARDANARRSN